ncbi:hypothetical protein CgunFtcFv8_020126 [Champsocephalus gunnari]|uniref:Uncharacterized protein n=1 Tax=Champsocephalus gunnari TaxID=52237 RepID=A0AAN8HSW4_CHAGU|nr:hypothetical protein CgunFtcFv8_020126 [Champsocephalus gunnari]
MKPPGLLQRLAAGGGQEEACESSVDLSAANLRGPSRLHTQHEDLKPVGCTTSSSHPEVGEVLRSCT